MGKNGPLWNAHCNGTDFRYGPIIINILARIFKIAMKPFQYHNDVNSMEIRDDNCILFQSTKN